MGILSTLDEKILQIYEKANHYCYKKFGTDKYDLAQKADVGASITETGVGTYFRDCSMPLSEENKTNKNIENKLTE